MKRGLAIALAVGLAVIVWPRDRGGLREGVWEGETSQGLWVSLTVEEGEDGPEIVKWGVAVALRCEESGRAIRGAVVSSAAIPIRDRRFAETGNRLTLFHEWAGAFTDDAARGTVSVVLPVITGDDLDSIGAETCSAPRLGFTVRPKDHESARPPVDFELRISPSGQMLRRF